MAKIRPNLNILLNIALWILITSVRVSSAGDYSAVLSKLYQQASQQDRPLVLVLDGKSNAEKPRQLSHQNQQRDDDVDERSESDDEDVPYPFLYLYKLAQEANKNKANDNARSSNRYKGIESHHRGYDDERNLNQKSKSKNNKNRNRNKNRQDDNENLGKYNKNWQDHRNRDRNDRNSNKLSNKNEKSRYRYEKQSQDRKNKAINVKNRNDDLDSDEREIKRLENSILASPLIRNLIKYSEGSLRQRKDSCEEKGKGDSCEKKKEEDPCEGNDNTCEVDTVKKDISTKGIPIDSSECVSDSYKCVK
ncbi:uncharacterized protein LOC142984206 [Anticarsia gemmatalis]|uniref:uncharacterized protein LOC142984206 n=1 Tax=Anticarsia gemmatalis TaxID=129554 RepID=UPI003F7597BA